VNETKKSLYQFVIPRAIGLVVGLGLLAAGISALFRQQGGWLPGASYVLLGASVLFVTFQRAAEVFRGKPALEQVVTLPLPGTAAYEVTVPQQMSCVFPGHDGTLLREGDTHESAGRRGVSSVGDPASHQAVANESAEMAANF
jgi:hypothetical protein